MNINPYLVSEDPETTRRRQLLNDYLLRKAFAESDQASVKDDRLQDAADKAADRQSQNAFLETLSKAASKAGSIGGKEAGSSMEGFSEAQAKADQMRLNAMAQAENRKEAQANKRLQLMQYLQEKQNEDAYRRATLGESSAKAKADLAFKESEASERRKRENQELALKREELALKRQQGQAESALKSLPVENQEIVKDLAKSNAKKETIKNQISSGLAQFQAAKTEDEKIRIGRGMIKVLNSTEGADAVGAEEAKRLADALEYKFANVFEPGPMFGRDLKGFENQALSTVDSIDNAIKMNKNQIDILYGREKSQKVKVPSRDIPVTGEGGSAIAAPMSGPKVGEEQDGYIFQGGDPASPQSWRKK